MPVSTDHNTPVRVALFVESLTGGGAEKITVILANGLVQRGYEVDLLMRWARGAFLKDIDPRVHQFSPANERGGAFSTLGFLINYLRQRHPKAILTQMEKPSLLALLAGALTRYQNVIPCVHTDLTTYARLEHSFRRSLLKYLVALFYRFARRIVAVSTGVARSTTKLIGAHAPPIDIIFNGFDCAATRRQAEDDCGIEWLQHKTVPVIVACGRFVEQKGYDTLLRAFAMLRQTIPCRLVILGEGFLQPVMQSLVTTLGIEPDVSMPGFHPNPASCFARSDLVAMASRVEGLSNVLVEALIVGAPIVSTDCPTGPREVLAQGKFGTLVPVDDAAALAKAMGTTLATPRRDWRDDPEYVAHLNNFSATNMLDLYSAVLSKV
jgi:glycosyltransferase involved in cell wall biosynthesis